MLWGGPYACECSDEHNRNVSSFRWVPESCTIPAWNAHAFCRRLRSRSVLFIGDSLMHQVARAVHNAVVGEGADCAPQLTYVISDTLVDRNDLGRQNRGNHWQKTAGTLRPDFLLLTLGAHLSETVTYRPLLEQVRDGFLADAALSSTKLIWMTSLGAGCDEPPLPKGVPLSKAPKDTPGFWTTPYIGPYDNWQVLEKWDDEAVEFWRGVRGASVLDMRPLWRRPDAKIGRKFNADGTLRKHDCVHLCSPDAGPLLLALELLYAEVARI